jgi:NAD(P)-dependent dehydrogenase (short-subunit alcohol dehydrogenase family)
MKIVIVGASSGIGRSVGVGLGKRGSTVALLARRKERLVDAAAEAGPGSLAIVCDVVDPLSCQKAIDEAAEGLGGIDALVYATGMGSLSRMIDTSAEDWRKTFDTNVIGAALVTAAAMPHLTASRGAAAYLSSVNGTLTPPWPGLGAYAASKAALETMVEAWRAEHPEVGFTRVIVGDCAGGEGDAISGFPNEWDWDLAGELYTTWSERKLLAGTLIDVEEIIQLVDAVLQCGASANIPSVAITPRPQI